MPIRFKKVTYNNENYAVIDIKFNDTEVPAVIDYKDIKYLKQLNKTWKCHRNGFLSTSHPFNGNDKERD